MLRKTKIIYKKSKKKFFSKIRKTSGRMVQGEQKPKFERNSCIRFRYNCVTDGRQTTDDGRIAISWALLIDRHSQAELKMQNFEKEGKKKNSLEIWQKGTFPPDLALICLTGSAKLYFTDRQRTVDGCPRDNSSSTVEYHKAELKNHVKNILS